MVRACLAEGKGEDEGGSGQKSNLVPLPFTLLDKSSFNLLRIKLPIYLTG
jgi:hypothetical protein